jgi:hypothetical protein
MYPTPLPGPGMGGSLAFTGFPVALYLSVATALIVAGLLLQRSGRVRAAGLLGGPLRA